MGDQSPIAGFLRGQESNGVLMLTVAQIGDLNDIDNRVKFGDESGWRGDPTMCVCIDKLTGMFEVWGLDSHNTPYKAVTHHKLNHEIIRKLIAGDWQKHDVIDEVMAANAALEAANAAKDKDNRMVVAEKMAWAIRQDFAQHLGGRGGVHAISRKVGAA